MQYKLINLETNQEFICEKVVVDGYEYYVYNNIDRNINDYYISQGFVSQNVFKWDKSQYKAYPNQKGVIIATNNSSLDIPQIVDEFESIISSDHPQNYREKAGFIKGYNKAKEQYTNTKQDMIEFAEWIKQNATTDQHFKQNWMTIDKRNLTTEQVLELFEQSRPKTIYFK